MSQTAGATPSAALTGVGEAIFSYGPSSGRYFVPVCSSKPSAIAVLWLVHQLRCAPTVHAATKSDGSTCGLQLYMPSK